MLAGDKQPELDGIDPALVGTIQRPDGQSLTFSLPGDVAVREEGKDGSLDDIKVGDRLMVFAAGGQAFLLRCISHPKAAS